MRRVVAIGPMPPPVHGMALVHARTVEAIAGIAKIDVIPVMPGASPRGLRYHLGKLGRVIVAVPRLLLARARGARALYYAVDAGAGGYYGCLFVSAARVLGLKTYLHHHNYNYLVVSTRPMRWLTAIAGRRARHIVLCARMAQDMVALYPAVGRTIVVPNGIVLPPAPVRAHHGGPLRLGLMSNLTPEKGVDEFLAIVDRLRLDGLPVTGTLAGPVSPPALAARVAQRAEDGTNGIDWLGPLDEAGKARFFAAIDLFVFPTHMESFGLVLLEALAHGVPVVAPMHGCICLFEGSESATIVPTDVDFIDAACRVVREMAKRPDRNGMASAARGQAVRLNADALARQQVLVTEIAR